MYSQLDMTEGDPADDAQDTNGYLGLGKYERKKLGPLKPISENEFVQVFRRKNKMQDIMNIIK